LLVTVTAPPQLSVAATAPVFGAGTAEAQLTVVFAGMLVIVGAVLSMRVLYVVVLVLPQPSLTVTVITAWHVPVVDAVSVSGPVQLSVAVVAASAAASAAATVL
jgi:hypothetical protein